MKSLSFIMLGLCFGLSGCYVPTLIAENRDGNVVYLRNKHYARHYSDDTAQKYCQQYQKPSTWVSTIMNKYGNFHDAYKCGAVPPAKLALEDKDNQPYQPTYGDDAENRTRNETQPRNEAISGDYFGSRRTQVKSNDDW